jgi:LysR family transcriptional regulator, hydrogen peroxide-inducible genes activator
MPSLRQLEYLLALRQTAHFRRAAERVGVSQPTLSAQLKTLEDRLGVQLVERDRSRVVFTAVGEQVLAIAERVLRDVQEMRDVAVSHRDGLGGVIRMGVPATIGPYLVPRTVPGLHAAYPKLKLYVREGRPDELPEALLRGVHDVLIAPIPIKSADLETLPLFREPLYLIASADHPFASVKEVERTRLQGQSVLTLGRGHQLQAQVEALCAEFGANLLNNYEGTSLDTLRQMVGMGMGISFLPGLYVRTAMARDDSLHVLQLKGRALYRSIGLVWRASSARGPEFRKLGEHLLTTIRRDFADFTLL